MQTSFSDSDATDSSRKETFEQFLQRMMKGKGIENISTLSH
jgi:hypothetical protein